MKNDYVKSGQALQKTHDNSPRAQVASFNTFLQARMKQIANWVTQGVRPEALVRFTLMELSTNEKLRACTPESIYLGLLACATTGLEPGALKAEAFLVPFAGKATFIPGWRGLVKQARRSREIVGMTANVVRANDVFDIDLGTANTLIHKPAGSNRGDVVGAYAIATFAGGHHEIEHMDREDLDAIEKVATSRGKSPAWKDWQDQMQRKAPLRRLAKRLPLGSDYYVALALERAADEGRDQKEVLDVMAENGQSADSGAASAPQITVDEPASDPETMTQ